MNEWEFSKDIMLLVKKIGKSSVIEPPRPDKFRVSGLPYCPILDIHQSRALSLYSESEYSKSVYTRVGTAIHEAFQLHVEHLDPSVPYGDWECSRVLSSKDKDNKKTIVTCNKVVSHLTLENASKAIKKSCPHGHDDCHLHLKYKELELMYKGVLSGHTDMLFFYKGKIYLIDVKTTSNYIIKGSKKEPAKTYQEQIETYAFILWKKYKIKVDYVVILYVAREKSISKSATPVKIYAKKVTPAFLKKRRDLTHHYVKLYKMRRKVGFPADLSKKEAIEALAENRPCKTMKDYNEKMKFKFEVAQSNCPMLNFCINRPKHIIQGLKGAHT